MVREKGKLQVWWTFFRKLKKKKKKEKKKKKKEKKRKKKNDFASLFAAICRKCRSIFIFKKVLNSVNKVLNSVFSPKIFVSTCYLPKSDL